MFVERVSGGRGNRESASWGRRRFRLIYIHVITCCSDSFVTINKDASEEKQNQIYATIHKQQKSVVPPIVLCAFHSTLIPSHLLSSYQWLLNLPLLLAKLLLPPPLKHPQNRPKVQRQPRRLPSLRLLRVKRRSERRSERRRTLLISTRVGLLQCLVDVCSRRV